MIKIIDGDLLESGADIICHQVNCQGKMNSGIAKQIREKYPEVYLQYKQLCTRKSNLLGHYQTVHTNDGTYIVNFFSQNNYGYDGKQYTDLDALRKCLLGIKAQFAFLKQGKGEPGTERFRLAMPYKIGCCRGGANWDEVYDIIDEVFKDYEVELWRLDKG